MKVYLYLDNNNFILKLDSIKVDIRFNNYIFLNDLSDITVCSELNKTFYKNYFNNNYKYLFILFRDNTKDQKELYKKNIISKISENNISVYLYSNDIYWKRLCFIEGCDKVKVNYNFIDDKPLKSLKILSILDDFSYNCYKNECDLIILNPFKWKYQFDILKPDMFLVESVWSSVITKIGLHEYHDDVSILLLDIIKYCKEKNIPAVFWNKEDGINYNLFIWVAKYFPYVFTTDINCINKYKKDCKHNNIFTLMFAAQPLLHNPFNRSNDYNLLFAGRWYYGRDFIKRRESMKILINNNKLNDLYDLHIYDRNYNKLLNKQSFPKKYNKYLRESVKYTKLCKLYKKYRIMLNVNSICDSTTMFSRRVFEALACKTMVLTTESPGIRKLFPNVNISKSAKDTNYILNNIMKNYKYYEKDNYDTYINIMKNHTYTNRLEYIADILEIEFTKKFEKIICISFVDSEEDNNKIITTFKKQTYMNKSLIIFKKVKEGDKIINTILDKNIMQFSYYKLNDNIKDFINSIKNSYIFLLSSNSKYGKNYIDEYLINFYYMPSEINILTKSINNEDKMVKLINISEGSLCFRKNCEKLFLNYIENIENICKEYIYSVDRYNYSE